MAWARIVTPPAAALILIAAGLSLAGCVTAGPTATITPAERADKLASTSARAPGTSAAAGG